jgi:ATP-dependent exoDNAse (exonuclease V) beta subunit
MPADIAILVRDGKEAQAVRAELSARGVCAASIYRTRIRCSLRRKRTTS